jgi:hypothetical protein
MVASLERAIESATPEQLKALIRLLVGRITTKARRIDEIMFVPAALPFFAPQQTLLKRPRTDSNRRRQP